MPVTKTVRTFLERLTRRWVYFRKLPEEFGGNPIAVTPAAGLKYLFKSMTDIDPTLLLLVSKLVRPGNCIWDIGANVGIFTFAAAAKAGPSGSVVAFEPDAWLVQILRKSVRAQSSASASVRIVPSAVASKLDLREFSIAVRSRASNSLSGYGHSQTGGIEETQVVVTLPLDWLLERLPLPDVVKCDVEGAEVEVFEDQFRILREIRPVVVCEVGEATSQRITEIFLGENYRLFDGGRDIALASEVRQAVWNTVAIPAERCADYGIA